MWSSGFSLELQREKEKEGPSTRCTAVQGLCKYIPVPLPQAVW